MTKLPLHLTASRINSAQSAPIRLGFVGRKIGTAVIRMSHFVGLRRSAEKVALLSRSHVKKTSSRVETWGHPVRGTQRPRANRPPLRRRRTFLVSDRATLSILAIAPRGPAIGVGREQLARGAI